MPTRTSIALAGFLALICLGATIASAIHHDWVWACAGLTAAGAFAYEALGGITERRYHRNTHPIAPDRPKGRQR